jgi:hypothetical protein
MVELAGSAGLLNRLAALPHITQMMLKLRSASITAADDIMRSPRCLLTKTNRRKALSAADHDER